MSKYLGSTGALYVITKIKSLLSGKVDAVEGKGLSSNDYTTSEKTKLSGISSGAQVNVIESIKVNGTAQSVSGKSVNITVPTNNNQLTNGAGYQTASQVQTLINNAGHLKRIKVDALPTSGIDTNAIYMVAKSSSSASNLYDEYMYIDDKWELIGNSETDLSGYLKTSDMVELTTSEIDTMFN